ncbi:MAG: adenine methyltransferase [Candidatus Atribacteria bacterium]|nr:adenine methyltransferase [Candidatus Atribacteria bacterium]
MFGLDIAWGRVSYCNPSYGPEVPKWIEKGIAESRLGKVVVFLLPSRTGNKWFHDLILPFAAEIRFLRGRLYFGGPRSTGGRAPFDSMLAVFRG